MTTNVSTKNFDLSQNTKDNVIVPAIDRKLSPLTESVNVTVVQEGRRIIVKLKTQSYSTEINATGSDVKLVKALGEAIDIMKRKIRKAKTHSSVKSKTPTVTDEHSEERVPRITSSKHIVLNAMSDEEALYQAEMLDHEIFHYRDESGNLAFLVKKKNDYEKITIE